MKVETNRLAQENRQLQESLHLQQTSSSTSQELSSLAPQVLNQVKKTIRKLGGDITSSPISESTNDNTKNKVEGKFVSFVVFGFSVYTTF